MNLAEHPTVRRFRESNRPGNAEPPQTLDAAWLRQLCLDCGADDAGLAEISRPALDDQRADILRAFPPTKTLLSFVCRMNREPIRSPARSVANLEFHHTGDHVNEVARKIVATLEKKGIRALNPAMGFPMEMDRFPGGKIWVVSHKPVAVAAGLGHMGIHRAGLPGERAESAVGTAPQENPHQRIAETAGRFRQVFSVVSRFERRNKPELRGARTE